MENIRAEDKIIASWEEGCGQPLVSICCPTYNHEDFIEETLKGFLIQETNFPFEIIVHDDASIDRTADIVLEYQQKYPKIIKSIFQLENKFSQGIKVAPEYLFPESKGSYIAICDGDDAWIDSKKLMKQINLMKKYPNVQLSFHPAVNVLCDNTRLKTYVGRYGDEASVISNKKIYYMGGSSMPTSSIVFRVDYLKSSEFRKWLEMVKVGDVVFKIFFSKFAGALYCPDVMSVYRIGRKNQWSAIYDDISKSYTHRKRMTYAYSVISKNSGSIGKYLRFNSIKGNIMFTFKCFSQMKIKYFFLGVYLIIFSIIK